jgi:YHS domain-containing protein
MTLIKKVGIGAVALAVIGFAGFQGFMYSIGYYASEPIFQTSRGALDGYDPVAYFVQGKPLEGKPELTYAWEGATWRFASPENLAAFRQAPERYAPQFGGYCAYAVASGYTAKTTPEAWHVADGKLYLNFDESVRENWLKDKANFIVAAEKNWPAVIKD